MNNLLSRLSQWSGKFLTNKHVRIGLPFIMTVCVGPSLMKTFVEIQYMFGTVKNVDKIQEEINKKEGPKRSREDILREGYKEMIEDRRDFLEQWEPVRVSRPWEEQDDTFKHYVTKEDLRLKD